MKAPPSNLLLIFLYILFPSISTMTYVDPSFQNNVSFSNLTFSSISEAIINANQGLLENIIFVGNSINQTEKINFSNLSLNFSF